MNAVCKLSTLKWFKFVIMQQIVLNRRKINMYILSDILLCSIAEY